MMREHLTADRIEQKTHFPELDGWRAISILLVLACHMLPLGPKRMNLNYAAGLLGMTLFFALSGFLITLSLYQLHDTRVFFIRRLTRILPAYVVATAIALTIDRATFAQWVDYLLFRINYKFDILPFTGPFWSLCVEIHFYIAIGLLMLVTRFRGFWLLPIGFVVLTACRANFHWGDSIRTHERGNELLGGATLAFAYARYTTRCKQFLSVVPWLIWLPALLITSHPASAGFQYLRPLVAIYGIGQTLTLPEASIFKPLRSATFRYLASISYALYLFHALTMLGWLGNGSKMAIYLKRPICFALMFLIAHVSTFTYEAYFNRLGRRWSRMLENSNKPSAANSHSMASSPPLANINSSFVAPSA